jgi:signal transduction histidine kinase
VPNFAIAILIKPFVLLILSVCVLIPARMAVERRMKDGKLKRLLLRRIGD